MARMNTPVAVIQSRLLDFVSAERMQYSGQGNNLFALGLGQVQRYEFFLQIILGRYHEISAEFLAAVRAQRDMGSQHGPGQYQPSPEEIEALNRMRVLDPYIQLESESFYIFAKTLLDRLAKFLEDYFRPMHSEKALSRRFSFHSHDALTKKFEVFAAERGLDVPVEFVPRMKEMKEKICDFRDYQISHNQNMRVAHATTFSLDGAQPRMMKSPMFSSDWAAGMQPVESIPLDNLMALLEKYLEVVFELIVRNRKHSAFLRSAPAQQPAA